MDYPLIIINHWHLLVKNAYRAYTAYGSMKDVPDKVCVDKDGFQRVRKHVANMSKKEFKDIKSTSLDFIDALETACNLFKDQFDANQAVRASCDKANKKAADMQHKLDELAKEKPAVSLLLFKDTLINIPEGYVTPDEAEALARRVKSDGFGVLPNDCMISKVPEKS